MTGTERKVLNKYYPPDFDPRKLPKVTVPRNRQYVIRVMAPFNMRCNTCGEYIYKGKKFNARRETVEDETYLGLAIFRFYIRCPQCLAEITFKTDLKNCDYAQEHGSTRLFEAEKLLREKEAKEQEIEAEEKTNPMKMLEKRTKMSRFEMEALERLEELREINRRHVNVDHEEMLMRTREAELEQLRREQEEEIQILREMGYIEGELPSDQKRLPVLRRLPDIDPDDIPTSSALPSASLSTKPAKISRPSKQKDLIVGSIIAKRKACGEADFSPPAKSTEVKDCTTDVPSAGMLSLNGYGSSSSDESDTKID